MGKRQRDWAHRKDAELKAKLGNKCAKCGLGPPLEFEHLFGRDWNMEKKDKSWRMSIITAEIEKGLIGLLCPTCNKKSWPRKGRVKPVVDTPF